MGAAGERNSVWWETADVPGFPPLGGDATTDVVVVGAGITGLTTALPGSRFAADGRVLNGPAVEDLQRVGPDADGGARWWCSPTSGRTE